LSVFRGDGKCRQDNIFYRETRQKTLNQIFQTRFAALGELNFLLLSSRSPNLEISFPYQLGAVATCERAIIVKQSFGTKSQRVPFCKFQAISKTTALLI